MSNRIVPDRLSSASTSPYFVKNHPLVRISVNGIEYTGRVLEYCISAGWAMVLKVDDKTNDPLPGKKGRPKYGMKRGSVIVWFASDPVPEGAILVGTDQPTEQHVLPA